MAKKADKYLVLEPGARRTFRLLIRTQQIPFNVFYKTTYLLSKTSYIT